MGHVKMLSLLCRLRICRHRREARRKLQFEASGLFLTDREKPQLSANPKPIHPMMLGGCLAVSVADNVTRQPGHRNQGDKGQRMRRGESPRRGMLEAQRG